MLPPKKILLFLVVFRAPKRSPVVAEVLKCTISSKPPIQKSSNCSSKVVEDVEMIEDNLRI